MSLRDTMNAEEERMVREVGEAIGYGRTMQLCEKLWGEYLAESGLPAGGAHSTYCCVIFLVPCICTETGDYSCDWCCGARRVTKKVAEAQRGQ